MLDRTFSLYRSHFGLFLGIFALPYMVVLAFQLVGLVFQSSVPKLSNILLTLAWSLGAGILTLTVSAVSEAATVIAVSNLQLGRPATVTDSFSKVKGHVSGVVGISFLVSMAAGVGLLAVIAPGVILLIIWSLAVPVKVLENKGVFDSMSRSMELTKGDWGRIFVIGLLILALKFGISSLLQWPVLIAAGFSLRGGVREFAVGWQVAVLLSGFVATSLVGALAMIAFSIVYYDERVRKEAFDLQLMMTTLDASALPPSPAQAGA
ncbi:MAG: hypothetical protein ACLPHP_10805 [Candidatus Sulfotelmatobacter sp.]